MSAASCAATWTGSSRRSERGPRVLAYLFWHRPRDPDAVTAYEQALSTFHRSLARSLPVGTLASASFRVAELPWPSPSEESAVAYEDWYLVEDFAALGVLNEAAVGRGHVSAHDEAARRAGPGTAGIYALIEGEPCAQALGEASLAIWIARPAGSTQRGLGEPARRRHGPSAREPLAQADEPRPSA